MNRTYRNKATILLLTATMVSIGMLDYSVDTLFGANAFATPRFCLDRKVFDVSAVPRFNRENILKDRQATFDTNDIYGGKSKGRIYVGKRVNKPKENRASKKLSDYFATTIPGMEKVLAKELQSLTDVEMSSIVIGKSGVHFRGTKLTGMDSLIWLRTPLRVMERLATSDAIVDPQSLYDFCRSVDWKSLLHRNNTFKCDAVLGRDIPRGLSHSQYTAMTLRNAIKDCFRELDNTDVEDSSPPSTDVSEPHLSLSLYLDRSSAMLYRVWSGVGSLHKRGYRDSNSPTHKAALRETTAAFMLLVAGWNSSCTANASRPLCLCDPMCGSGTIPIEAALIAADVAPGLIRYRSSGERQQPSILKWPDMDAQQWEELLDRAQQRDRRPAMNSPLHGAFILANDCHEGSLRLAAQSAGLAGVKEMIRFSCGDVDQLADKLLEDDSENAMLPDIIATNPPWDKRLESGSGDDGDSAWRKLIEFARAVWDPKARRPSPSSSEVEDRRSLLPPRYPLWMLSGNERMMWYFDDSLNAKAAYVHNIKSQSAAGNLQLLKYFFKSSQ